MEEIVYNIKTIQNSQPTLWNNNIKKGGTDV